jgi:hypothetical protein
VSVASIVFVMLMVVVIAVGSWLSSRAQPTPTDRAVDAAAVVVTSLACTDGVGGTVIDVLNPAGLPAGGVVRASLDACGYQEGQQIAVRYPAGDPTQVTLAGTDSDSDLVTGDRLLPIALVFAALLVVGAGFAMWTDDRRRRAKVVGHRRAAHEIDEPEDIGTSLAGLDPAASAGHVLPELLDHAGPDHVGPDHVGLDHAGLDDNELDDNELDDTEPPDRPRRGRHALPDTEDGSAVGAGAQFGALSAIQVLPAPRTKPRTLGDWSVAPTERQLSSVDLVFPFTSSLAASLQDELFTHRGSSG